MITLVEAMEFAEKNFPEGPERLAQEMGIDVRVGPLVGCDGWVLSGSAGIIIRLNENSSPSRRRFTLAHELGHLLLGIPTVVGETFDDALKSNDTEERLVNDLAGALLLPESVVRGALPSIPVVASQLEKLAKKAKVSQLSVAIRVVNLAAEIGLRNAAVAFFQDDLYQWHFSTTLKMTADQASRIFHEWKEGKQNPVRISNDKSNLDVVIASAIENPQWGSTTLFVQLLPSDSANKVTSEERRRELESFLFAGDVSFRNQIQGVFGSFRPHCATMSLEEAYMIFFEEKVRRWSGERLERISSPQGREYVKLRLSEWCK